MEIEAVPPPSPGRWPKGEIGWEEPGKSENIHS